MKKMKKDTEKEMRGSVEAGVGAKEILNSSYKKPFFSL